MPVAPSCAAGASWLVQLGHRLALAGMPVQQPGVYAAWFSFWAALAWACGVARFGGGLALGSGVDFRAQQDGDAGQAEPEDEDGYPGDGAVGLAVVAEPGHIEGETQRGRQEDTGAGLYTSLIIASSTAATPQTRRST